MKPEDMLQKLYISNNGLFWNWVCSLLHIDDIVLCNSFFLNLISLSVIIDPWCNLYRWTTVFRLQKTIWLKVSRPLRAPHTSSATRLIPSALTVNWSVNIYSKESKIYDHWWYFQISLPNSESLSLSSALHF